MSERDRFDDPILSQRVQSWMDEQRRVQAPGRLVDAVMAEVTAAPRRRGLRGRLAFPRWEGIAAYGALTVVIAIGVTVGILFASLLRPGVGTPTAAPSASPSPTAGPTSPPPSGVGSSVAPAPIALSVAGDVALDASSIAATADSVWAADRGGRLVELDPASGDVRRSVDLPRPAGSLLVTSDSVWAASIDGNLVRVDRATLAIVEIPGAVGVALADGGDAIWLGGADEVVRIDPGTNLVSRRVAVAGRSADLGIVAINDAIWVATRTAILRLAAADGAETARIGGDASQLATAGGWLWATRGTELLRIDPLTAVIMAFISGVPKGPMVLADGHAWVAGPPGAAVGDVVGVDTATDQIAFTGLVPSGVAALAVGSGGIWIAGDEGAAIHRFLKP